MRSRAFRRHQTQRHMWRRLKEDRNQHYDNLSCACWTDKRAMAKFKEQPQKPQCYCCSNQRWAYQQWNPTMQERRALSSEEERRSYKPKVEVS